MIQSLCTGPSDTVQSEYMHNIPRGLPVQTDFDLERVRGLVQLQVIVRFLKTEIYRDSLKDSSAQPLHQFSLGRELLPKDFFPDCEACQEH